MWLLTAIEHGFALNTHEWRLQAFRVMLGLGCFVKTGVSVFCGDWGRVDQRAFGYYSVLRRHGHVRAELIRLTHKPLLVIRLIASAALMAGVGSRIACCVLGLGLFAELYWEYRFNTIYLMCCLLAILPAERLDGYSDRVVSSQGNTWAQALVVLVTIDLYWNSAWCKIRSAQFRSGMLLAQVFNGAASLRHLMPRWEFWHPAWLGRMARAPGAAGVWQTLSIGVIGAEVLLPIGLLFPEQWAMTAVVGLVLHVGFVILLPLRLIPFQIVTISTYLLFLR
ncbi:MAG TPA: hypothetical protein VH561_13945 [Micromonosporaceae bacterium]